MIKVGSDFSGVGAFNQALLRLGIEYDEVFACDMDKYARQTFELNYGKPKYYPENVYDREIPEESLDIYMTSPPCQSFSLAGKRKGEDSKNGVLFYNSHEFIKKNMPRYFIFENVKGLLSSKSCITYSNSLYLLLYNFKQIKEWEKLSYQKSNLNLLSQSITNYLCLNYAKKLGLKTKTSGMSYITNSELGYEKLETKVKSGLKRRLKFLEDRICQITTKSNYYQGVMTVPLGCKEEDLVLSQEQSYLIENLIPTVINLLEKTVDINVNTSLFANNILEDNSRSGKLYTTLTELNSITTKETFMYVLESNIIRLIILALDSSSNLWKEIWLILTGKKEFIGLKTFDVWLFNLDHLNYHVYYQVLNAKHYGVPQNRERIFIIGIRDDQDNEFSFPKPFPLTKRLKDVLEPEVDEKYFLSDKMVNVLAHHQNKIIKNETPEESGCIHAGYFKMGGRDQQYIKDELTQVGSLYENNSDAGRIYDTNSISCTLKSDGGGGGAKTGLYAVEDKRAIIIPANNSKGYDIAEEEEDSINFSVPSSETRRGRVGHGVSQTLDTACNQGIYTKQRIRRLTPREYMNLMNFNEDFIEKTINSNLISDSQLYRQCGNSIVVNVLCEIIKKLKLK